MKKLIFLLLAMLALTSMEAQIFTEDGRYEFFGKDDPNLFKATGTPYLHDNFLPGKIVFKQKPDLSVDLRYNIYDENFQIKMKEEKKENYTVADWENAIYFLNGQKFISSEIEHGGRKIKGFFIEHYDGGNYKLLEKPEIKVVPPRRSDSGYSEDESAKIKKSSSFYIFKPDAEIVEVKMKHKDIAKAFSSTAAKEYLSNNKIREVKDLVAFLQHLDKQKV